MSELAKALLAFQKEAPTLHKGAEGQVGTRKYKYLGLEDLVAAVRPLLNGKGIVFTQSVEPLAGGAWLTTRLMHAESGDTASFSVPLVDADNMQALGSAITYGRRYGLVAALGLVADNDDDGQAAQGRTSSATRSNGELGSEAQVQLAGMLRTKLIEHGVFTEAEFRKTLKDAAGVESIKELSKDDIGVLIEQLQTRVKEAEIPF